VRVMIGTRSASKRPKFKIEVWRSCQVWASNYSIRFVSSTHLQYLIYAISMHAYYLIQLWWWGQRQQKQGLFFVGECVVVL